MMMAYYQQADVIALEYSVACREGFECLYDLFDEVDTWPQTDAERLLIATKADIQDRQFSIDEAEKWAIDYNMAYVDLSGRDGAKVNLLSKIMIVVEKEHSIAN